MRTAKRLIVIVAAATTLSGLATMASTQSAAVRPTVIATPPNGANQTNSVNTARAVRLRAVPPATAHPAPSLHPPTLAITASTPTESHVNAAPYADSAAVRWCPDFGNAGAHTSCEAGPIDRVPNGTGVVMRCWTDTVDATSQNPAWTSKRWFYVTEIHHTPQYSGYMYSGLIPVSEQIPTPNCDTSDFESTYPFDPSAGSVTIAQTLDYPDVLSIHTDWIAYGPATLYCHVGSGYPTGGSVVGRSITISGEYADAFFSIPLCASSGTMWIGIVASDGYIYYSNQLNIGSNNPPPPPQPVPGYLGGQATWMSFIGSPGDFVGANIAVDGLTVENYGQTPVVIDQLALGITDPRGSRTETTCTFPGTATAILNMTVAPGQIVECAASFSPDLSGTWTVNLDYQDSGAQWRLDYLYLPITIQIDARPAPANDNFANAQDITYSGAFSGDTTYATAEAGEPSHLNDPEFPAAHSLWYRFTAASSGRAWVVMDTDHYMVTATAAYTGSALSNLTRLAYWNYNNSDQIAFLVTAGETYYFAIDVFDQFPPGKFAGSYRIDTTTPPGNDDFDQATPMVPGITYQTDLTDATVQAGEPLLEQDDPNIGSVWYSYRPAADVTLTFWPTGGDTGVYIGVFTGESVASLNDPVATGFLVPGEDASFPFTMNLAGGTTYYIDLNSAVGADPTTGITAPNRFEFRSEATAAPDWTPPTVTLTAPTVAAQTSAQTVVRWSGSDGYGSGIARYEVRYRVAAANGPFGAWVEPSVWSNLHTTLLTASTSLRGREYCYSVRATDRAGNQSNWSSARCVARTVDDRDLRPIGATWTRQLRSYDWLGTDTRTTLAGARLATTLPVIMNRVGLVATVCPSCGQVAVLIGSRRIGTINLYARTTRYQQLIMLPTTSTLSGVVTVTVLSRGKLVLVDGLAIAR